MTIEEIEKWYQEDPDRLWGDVHIKTLLVRIRELESERGGYKNGQMQLQQMVSDLMDVTAKWVGKVKELEIEFNKQNAYLKRLVEAVDRHRWSSRLKSCESRDEELYRIATEGKIETK